MPSLCDRSEFSETDYNKYHPYTLDPHLKCYLTNRRSLRVFETRQYHKLKVYAQRPMSVDRKMYPDWHNGCWRYPPCRGCDCQLIAFLTKDKVQKSVLVNTSSEVLDHPVYKNHKLGCGPHEKLTKFIQCEGFSNCKKKGIGKYWLFRPCPNCRDESVVSYRLSGTKIGLDFCVHVCDHCLSRCKYPSSSTFICGRVVGLRGSQCFHGRSRSSSRGCVYVRACVCE